MASHEISVVGENICAKLGEGPHWDTVTQKLLWVDSFDYKVHVSNVETGEVSQSQTSTRRENSTRSRLQLLKERIILSTGCYPVDKLQDFPAYNM